VVWNSLGDAVFGAWSSVLGPGLSFVERLLVKDEMKLRIERLKGAPDSTGLGGFTVADLCKYEREVAVWDVLARGCCEERRRIDAVDVDPEPEIRSSKRSVSTLVNPV
jgi:hypothetical protein